MTFAPMATPPPRRDCSPTPPAGDLPCVNRNIPGDFDRFRSGPRSPTVSTWNQLHFQPAGNVACPGDFRLRSHCHPLTSSRPTSGVSGHLPRSNPPAPNTVTRPLESACNHTLQPTYGCYEADRAFNQRRVLNKQYIQCIRRIPVADRHTIHDQHHFSPAPSTLPSAAL